MIERFYLKDYLSFEETGKSEIREYNTYLINPRIKLLQTDLIHILLKLFIAPAEFCLAL